MSGFSYPGPTPELAGRELLCAPVADHHRAALRSVGAPAGWTVELPPDLLFDTAGLDVIRRALAAYMGPAAELSLGLVVGAPCARDFYSLQGAAAGQPLPLGIVARRADGAARADGAVGGGELAVRLPVLGRVVPLPESMHGPQDVEVPLALLLRYRYPHDLLFANQIALGSELARRARSSPGTWFKALLGRRRGTFAHRVSLAYRAVHPTADVHPTAVLEGAVVGAGARIGAHCVVRYSMIGAEARIHDGAKVELSVVGARSWLMHDLVLYRSATEPDVFLIHGPYQFSYFHRASAAFATIMMDYRPDGKPIRASTPAGPRPYAGRFLGAVVGQGAKVLGGCLLAPGRVVPAATWLSPPPSQIHAPVDAGLPTLVPLPPDETRRTHARAEGP